MRYPSTKKALHLCSNRLLSSLGVILFTKFPLILPTSSQQMTYYPSIRSAVPWTGYQGHFGVLSSVQLQGLTKMCLCFHTHTPSQHSEAMGDAEQLVIPVSNWVTVWVWWVSEWHKDTGRTQTHKTVTSLSAEKFCTRSASWRWRDPIWHRSPGNETKILVAVSFSCQLHTEQAHIFSHKQLTENR